MFSINPHRDTLWKIAYGHEPSFFEKADTKIPDEEPLNRVAHDIIKNDKTAITIGKVCVIVGILLLTVGVALALVYSLSTPQASLNLMGEGFEWGCILSVTGAVWLGIGGYIWHRHRTCLEEDKTKPILEIIDRLGKDLAKIQNRKAKDAFKDAQFMEDWQKLFDALQPHVKKA